MRRHIDTFEAEGFVYVWEDEHGDEVCSDSYHEALKHDFWEDDAPVTIEYSADSGESPTRSRYAYEGHHPGCDPEVTVYSVTVSGGEWEGKPACTHQDAEVLTIEHIGGE